MTSIVALLLAVLLRQHQLLRKVVVMVYLMQLQTMVVMASGPTVPQTTQETKMKKATQVCTSYYDRSSFGLDPGTHTLP